MPPRLLPATWIALLLAACPGSDTETPDTLPPPALEQLERWAGVGPLFVNREGYSLFPAGSETFLKDPRFADALLDPSLWRELDREFRFGAILLAGDLAPARALLQHLRQTRDWTLVHLDHACVIFARGAVPWDARQLAEFLEQNAGDPPDLRSKMLTRAAGNLIALERHAEALPLLEESGALDPANAETLTLLAVLASTRERWAEALARAEEALAINGSWRPALFVRAQALFALGRFGEARQPSDRLLKMEPDNPGFLLLHAKIAHELSDFDSEIAALERIVTQLEARGLSTTFYRIYLGQARSANGDPETALAEFLQARDAGDATPGQSDFLERAISRLQEAEH